MQNVPQDLGRRIQEAAKLAVHVHLEADQREAHRRRGQKKSNVDQSSANGLTDLPGVAEDVFGTTADASAIGQGVFSASANIQLQARAQKDWAWLVKAAAELCAEREAA